MGNQASDRRDYESGGTQLTGEDYLAWGQDDTYVYEWLAAQLSLTIDSVEEGNYWDATSPEPQ